MQKTIRIMAAIALMTLGLTGCNDSDDGPTNVSRKMDARQGEVVKIGHGTDAATDGTWTLTASPDTQHSMVSADDGTAWLLPVSAGTYEVRYTAGDYTETVTVDVAARPDLSPYIARVVDVQPAPGQFTNIAPAWNEGDSHSRVIADADQRLAGKAQGSDVSLGGFGGYIVLAFDHTIANVDGERDFRIMGNSFYSDEVEKLDGYMTGNSEPGIVKVAYDRNGNGKPDADEWYEIAGSEHNNPKTVKDYTLTYYRPATEQNDADYHPGKDFITIKNYIRWTDNQGGEGYMQKNSFHTQTYYPGWAKETLVLSGTRLPDNAVDINGNGTYFTRYCYEWGYADSMPNDHPGSAIDISWAVDAQGKPVRLIGADFVLIQSGIHQDCGWIGETSTEVCGAVDLHLQEKQKQ